jgi:hypothetical protein
MTLNPKKHYAVGRIANPSRIHRRIGNPSYLVNNPGQFVIAWARKPTLPGAERTHVHVAISE